MHTEREPELVSSAASHSPPQHAGSGLQAHARLADGALGLVARTDRSPGGVEPLLQRDSASAGRPVRAAPRQGPRSGSRASPGSRDPPQTPTTRPSSSTSRREDRLESVVLRLEAHVVLLAEEALDGGLIPHQRHDDLAVRGRLLACARHVVALEDSGLLHRVALHAQDELALLAARRCGGTSTYSSMFSSASTG